MTISPAHSLAIKRHLESPLQRERFRPFFIARIVLAIPEAQHDGRPRPPYSVAPAGVFNTSVRTHPQVAGSTSGPAGSQRLVRRAKITASSERGRPRELTGSNRHESCALRPLFVRKPA